MMEMCAASNGKRQTLNQTGCNHCRKTKRIIRSKVIFQTLTWLIVNYGIYFNPFFPEIKSMSELDQCSNACFVSHVLVFKNSLTECFKMCFNLKTQCSWNMMIGQKLKKYLESNSNCPEMYCGFIYLCFEWSRGALKWMKGAASKRRKKVVYSVLTLKASRRSFASKFIPFKA